MKMKEKVLGTTVKGRIFRGLGVLAVALATTAAINDTARNGVTEAYDATAATVSKNINEAVTAVTGGDDPVISAPAASTAVDCGGDVPTAETYAAPVAQ